MAKTKTGLKSLVQRLSDYKFDSSDYIVLDTAVRRDAATGRLVTRKVGKERGAATK
jgi:hypothetical protein